MAGATAVDPTGKDHRLWSSLERILELQVDIAAMHAVMEGGAERMWGAVMLPVVRLVSQSVGRTKVGVGQTLPIEDEEPEKHSADLAVSEVSTEHSESENDDDDDIRGFGKRRDGEFARLAEQFVQHNIAIGGILNKVSTPVPLGHPVILFVERVRVVLSAAHWESGQSSKAAPLSSRSAHIDIGISCI